MDGPAANTADNEASGASKRRTDARYWLLILSGCTMGETAADLLSHGPLGLGYVLASILLGALVVAALVLQHLARRPSEGRYWTTIVVMSTAGTTLADALTRTLKLGYFWGSALLVAAFLGVLVVGHFARARADRVTPPPAVEVPRIDGWYWAAMMVASTLGTTLGDYTSNATPLGFGGSAAILFALLVVLIFIDRRAARPSEARYFATLITASTIGATTGDYLTKDDGLGLGYFWGNGLLLVFFVAVVLIGRRRKGPAIPALTAIG